MTTPATDVSNPVPPGVHPAPAGGGWLGGALSRPMSLDTGRASRPGAAVSAIRPASLRAGPPVLPPVPAVGPPPVPGVAPAAPLPPPVPPAPPVPALPLPAIPAGPLPPAG